MKQSNPRSAGSRQRKQALWLQVARLAEEGLSSREIAQRLGLSKATVDRWLRRIRQESAARQTLDPPCDVDPQESLAEPGPRSEPVAAEPVGAVAVGAVAATCGPVEKPEKAEPPPLTWAQKHTALVREAAEKKRRWKRYTDPRFCAYGWG